MMMEELYSISDHTDLCTTAPDNDNVIELTEAGIIGLDTLCRLCANRTDHLIPIYDGEGVEHELEAKINRYLPFKIERSQSMPVHCCYQCASTVLAWHELVEVSLEANRRLKALQEDAVVHLTQKYPRPDDDTSGGVLDVENTGLKAGPSLRWNVVDFKTYMSTVKSQQTTLLLNSSESRLVKNESADESGDEDDIPLSKRLVKKFKCATCKEIFKTEKKLQQHGLRTKHIVRSDTRIRRKQSEIKYRIFCDICGSGFTRNCDMVKHRRHVHADLQSSGRRSVDVKSEPDDSESLSCTLDPNVVLMDTLRSSVMQTSEVKREVVPLVLSQSPIKRRKKSEIVPTHFCDLCPKGFTRRYDMRKHRLQVHGDVPNETEDMRKTKAQKNLELLERCKIEFEGRTHYKCEICDRIVHMSYNFLRHQTVHTGVRAFFCHLCGKSFRMSSGLNRHIKESHFGVKKFPCDECGRCFASKSTRDDHMNIHWGLRPFVCDTCGKAFKSKASLHVHKTFHTDDKPFVCATCGKRFRRNQELKVHGWLHTGYKPYACPTCGSCFRLSQDLKRHQKTHEKGNEVACEECGNTFSQLRYLRNHLKTHRKAEMKLAAAVAAGVIDNGLHLQQLT